MKSSFDSKPTSNLWDQAAAKTARSLTVVPDKSIWDLAGASNTSASETRSFRYSTLVDHRNDISKLPIAPTNINSSTIDEMNSNDESENDIRSPVPLSREEKASAEVRALAAKLAPVLMEADEMLARELFSSPTNSEHNNCLPIYVDDDDMDDEMISLKNSEDILRKEMESAILDHSDDDEHTIDANSFVDEIQGNDIGPKSLFPRNKLADEGNENASNSYADDDYWLQREKLILNDEAAVTNVVNRRMDNYVDDDDVIKHGLDVNTSSSSNTKIRTQSSRYNPNPVSEIPDDQLHSTEDGNTNQAQDKNKNQHITTTRIKSAEPGNSSTINPVTPTPKNQLNNTIASNNATTTSTTGKDKTQKHYKSLSFSFMDVTSLFFDYESSNNNKRPQTSLLHQKINGNAHEAISHTKDRSSNLATKKIDQLNTPIFYNTSDGYSSPSKQRTKVESNPGASSDGESVLTPQHRNALPITYTFATHMEEIHLYNEQNCSWYAVDMSNFLFPSYSTLNQETKNGSTKSKRLLPVLVKEYCLSIPEKSLRRMYIGLKDDIARSRQNIKSSDLISPSHGYENISSLVLPVRTLTILVRPDVLCGAVMEAVSAALTNQVNAKIVKRQGGHCQALVPSAKAFVSHFDFNNDGARNMTSIDEANLAADMAVADAAAAYGFELGNDDIHETNGNMTIQKSPKQVLYPPFFVDIQLTTFKSERCERCLLIRVYPCSTIETDEDYKIDRHTDDVTDSEEFKFDGGDHTASKFDAVAEATASRLRECASLVQCIEIPDHVKRMRLNQHLSFIELKEMASKHLLRSYTACRSVNDGAVTLPSLNNEDFEIIKSSWRLVDAIWEELDNRDLTFATLVNSRFGAFPALPALDVHHCSQIRKISRDAMIIQLLKSAAELEDFAAEAELECANAISLLMPMFEQYAILPPAMPKRGKELSEYTLEYVSASESCPPWGEKVQMAMNRIQELTGKNNAVHAGTSDITFDLSLQSPTTIDSSRSSIEMSRQAVWMVLDAFQKQDDEEQVARLGRKNSQVMDRLYNMKKHDKLMVQLLDESVSVSEIAFTASSDFMTESNGFQEVPLIKWKIIADGANGICTITAHHILFVTQRIPIIGGYTRNLFPLIGVEFQVGEIPSSMFSSRSICINVIMEDCIVYSFKPVTDGVRLMSLLNVIKATTTMSPLDLSHYHAEPDLV